MQTFRSAAHPDGRSAAHMHGRALVRPLAACMLPVMIVTLVAVLEGRRVLPALAAASVGALLLSSAWVHFQLRRTPAAIYVTDGYAAVRSVWHVLQGQRSGLDWMPVLDVRERSSGVRATIGYESFALDEADWPDHGRLIDALVNALHHSPRSVAPEEA